MDAVSPTRSTRRPWDPFALTPSISGPKIGSVEDTKPKMFVFVLMPFTEKFTDLYELGVRQACKDAGAHCERVDETFFQEGILDRVYNQISKADAIVAIMTDRNPNVFYEVGYAHALGKRVCLVTSTAEEIPFDLKYYPHVVYNRIAELKTRVQNWVEWCIAHPSESFARAAVPVRILSEGTEVTSNYLAKLVASENSAELTFAIHNPTSFMYQKGSFQVGIVTPRVFISCCSTRKEECPPDTRLEMEYVEGPFPGHRYPVSRAVVVPQWEHPEAQQFPLADGRTLHLLDWWSQMLFPNGWASVSCTLSWKETAIDQIHEFSIRLFTELGLKDFPFKVQIVEES